MNLDIYPLRSIYETEHQAAPRSEVSQNVDERMSEYLQEGYLEKVYDRPDVAIVDPTAKQLVRLTEKGEKALEEIIEEEL